MDGLTELVISEPLGGAPHSGAPRRRRQSLVIDPMKLEPGHFISLRHSLEAVGVVRWTLPKPPKIPKRCNIAFKNGAKAWFQIKHLTQISEADYDDASGVFKITKPPKAPQQLAQKPPVKGTPVLSESSEIKPKPRKARGSVHMEDIKEMEEVGAVDIGVAVMHVSTLSQSNAASKRLSVELDLDQTLQHIGAERSLRRESVELKPAADSDALHATAVGTVVDEDIGSGIGIAAVVLADTGTVAISKVASRKSVELTSAQLLDDTSIERQCESEGGDASIHIDDVSVESTLKSTTDVISDEQIIADECLEASKKVKKKKKKKKTSPHRKKKAVASKRESVTMAERFRRKREFLYKLSDKREVCFKMICDECNEIHLHSLRQYLAYLLSAQSTQATGSSELSAVDASDAQMEAFFQYLKPGPRGTVTFSRFVSKIDTDGDLVAAFCNWLQSGDSRKDRAKGHLEEKTRC